MTRTVPTSVARAVFDFDLEQLRRLVAKGADLNQAAGPRAPLPGYSPLMAAITAAHANAAKVDGATGEPLPASWPQAVSSELSASRKRAMEMLTVLLEAGADVNRVCPFRSPLNLAAFHGDLEVVDLLLQYHADPAGLCNSPTSNLSRRVGRRFQAGYSHTALHEAAQRGYEDICRALVAAGAEVDMLDHEGRSAAQLAIKGGHVQLAAFLKRQSRATKAPVAT